MARFQELYGWDGLVKQDVCAMSFSRDAQYLAVASASGPVFIFDTAKGECKYAIENPPNAVPNCILWMEANRGPKEAAELFVGRSDRCATSYYVDHTVRCVLASVEGHQHI